MEGIECAALLAFRNRTLSLQPLDSARAGKATGAKCGIGRIERSPAAWACGAFRLCVDRLLMKGLDLGGGHERSGLMVHEH